MKNSFQDATRNDDEWGEILKAITIKSTHNNVY